MFTIQFGSYNLPNTTFVLSSLPLNNNSKETSVPRMHGSVMPKFYIKSRTIKISGRLHDPDPENVLAQLLDLQKNLLNDEQPLYLRADRYIKARLFDFDNSYNDGTDKRVIDCDLSFKASIPFFYSAGASYSTIQAVSGTTINFNVVNGGNVFVEPKIYIYANGATISDNIKLFNNTDGGSFFRYRGILPAGQTLLIDSEAIAVLVNGADGLSNFEGNFLNIIPGTNSFQFVGANCQVAVENKYRWYD